MTLLSAFNWNIVWWAVIGVVVLIAVIVLFKGITDWKRGDDDSRERAKAEKKLAKKEAKKARRSAKKGKSAGTADAAAKKRIADGSADKLQTEIKPAMKAQKTEKKKKKNKHEFVEDVNADPLVRILGFDPYAAIRADECEIVEEYRNPEHETEDMRALREKMKTKQELQTAIETYSERRAKVKYEVGKTSRYLRDNGVIISSTGVVNDKLRRELTQLTADKKTEKQNKKNIETVKGRLAENESLIAGLERSVAEKTREEKLLRDAYNYLTSEIAKCERDLAYVQADVDKLNGRVGVELKKLEDDGRARALMNKYSELKPLLTTVNSVFREINESDAALTELHAEKGRLRQQLDGLMDELKLSYGAGETEKLSLKINELNKKMLALDVREEKLIAKKEDRIAQFKLAKRKANEFLDKERYSLEDIVVAEDKVIGELEYENVKKEYESKKAATGKRLDAAQRRHDELSSRKVKFKKNETDKKQAHENEVAAALIELRSARVEHDKARNDCDRILPSLMPTSLIKSGSGVISRERILEKQSVGKTGELVDAEKLKERLERELEAKQQAEDVDRSKQPEFAEKPAFVDKYEGIPTEQLVKRLETLERIALREKSARALVRSREQYGTAPSDVERAKAQVVAMRKNLKYISGPDDAKEFKQRLYRLSISLSDDAMRDNVLSEMIRRTMDEATYLGDRARKNGGYKG